MNRFDTASGLVNVDFFAHGGGDDGLLSESGTPPQLIGFGPSEAGAPDDPAATSFGLLGDGGQNNPIGPPGLLSSFLAGQLDPGPAAANGAGIANVGPGTGGGSGPDIIGGGNLAGPGILRSLPASTNAASADDLSASTAPTPAQTGTVQTTLANQMSLASPASSGPALMALNEGAAPAMGNTASPVSVSDSTSVITGSSTNFSVSTSGSGLVFNNTIVGTYPGSTLTEFDNDVILAEQALEKEATNSVTINVVLDGTSQGANGDGADNAFDLYGFSYSALRSALQTQEEQSGNTYGNTAALNLPATSVYSGDTFYLPTSYARMLGLTNASGGVGIDPSGNFTSGSFDDAVVLNTYYVSDYGQDAVNALMHELSEGGMGRIGGLGDQNGVWSTMDLFRYTAGGTLDDSDGRDNTLTYFSYNGGASSSQSVGLYFNNEYSGATYENGADVADWGLTDPTADVFGDVSTVAGLSQTDDEILGALGWTPMAPALPDLRAYVTLASSTAPAEGSVGVNLYDLNFGSGAAGASTTTLYISSTATIDGSGSDTVIGTVSEGALPGWPTSGWYDLHNLSLTLPNLAPGTYYIGAIADTGHQVTESNPTNQNFGSAQITVIAPGASPAVAGHSSVFTSGAGQTLANGISTGTDTVVGFADGGGGIKLPANSTTNALASSTIVNGGQDTQITMADGSTLLLKGITHIENGIFGYG